MSRPLGGHSDLLGRSRLRLCPGLRLFFSRRLRLGRFHGCSGKCRLRASRRLRRRGGLAHLDHRPDLTSPLVRRRSLLATTCKDGHPHGRQHQHADPAGGKQEVPPASARGALQACYQPYRRRGSRPFRDGFGPLDSAARFVAVLPCGKPIFRRAHHRSFRGRLIRGRLRCSRDTTCGRHAAIKRDFHRLWDWAGCFGRGTLRKARRHTGWLGSGWNHGWGRRKLRGRGSTLGRCSGACGRRACGRSRSRWADGGW
jgi:hypothetical protein